MIVVSIKNMVCNRCIFMVTQIFRENGIDPLQVELGKVYLARPIPENKLKDLQERLTAYGFEWIDDKLTRTLEQVRTAVIQYVHYDDVSGKMNLSEYISRQCNHDYSALSKLFTEANGITIEKYCIAQRVERAKELLVYDELSVSEIADLLHYSSTAHFSSQFRTVTGMSPTQFKQLKQPGRTPLDKVAWNKQKRD